MRTSFRKQVLMDQEHLDPEMVISGEMLEDGTTASMLSQEAAVLLLPQRAASLLRETTVSLSLRELANPSDLFQLPDGDLIHLGYDAEGNIIIFH